MKGIEMDSIGVKAQQNKMAVTAGNDGDDGYEIESENESENGEYLSEAQQTTTEPINTEMCQDFHWCHCHYINPRLSLPMLKCLL